uniref:Helicase n=1 Tax=viral metagenome TaxID=1070528 RepID=A0A6C0KHL6_9ZZZZ
MTTELIPTENSTSEMIFEDWEDDHVNLKISLLRGIYGYGFEHPSPIQKKSILPFINKKDIIAQAQSGTGKTGAFTISILQLVDPSKKSIQAIILSPTRELSRQTFNVFNALSVQMDVKSKLLIGGNSTDEDIEDLRNNDYQVIIGCPGRIQYMLKKNIIQCSETSILVLDEADEVLSSGFKDQIYNIFQYLNGDVQVALYSATLPSEIYNLTNRFMREPTKILVKQDMLTLQGIKQYYVGLDNDEHKFLALKDIFKTISMTQCIIYCNSIKRVDDLYEAMTSDDFPVDKIHSNMNEMERNKGYQDFKNGKSRVLIATDLFARGIDVQQVSIVINFDVPKSINTYLHRIGRSGRWGRKGMGINFMTKRDSFKIKEIERFYHTEIIALPTNFSEDIF